ncbi:DUF2163 domain-containing protein [Amaricoccus macauensis]|uniref:DUF2163 domain-containing protein n=1 Tax=Amaricoccus macauensis TaxID=57001 RepID=UPI003C7D7978
MRDIPPELRAHLDSGATTLCRCWKIERRDGVVLGFTDHDVDLSFDGLQFEAGSGLNASALQSSTGLSVDSCQAQGALSADKISESDIRAGRFDNAAIFHWLVNWKDPVQRVLLFNGTLGEIRRADGQFEVELRGAAEALNSPVGRTMTRTCDRILGDEKCKFDLTVPGYTFEGEIAVVNDSTRLAFTDISGFAAEWFCHGSVSWISGENSGLARSVRADRILEDGRREIELWQALPSSPSVGDRVRLKAGCDKSAEMCRHKFSNFLNFRGFPHLPGEDWVTAYPKDGDVHDGSSLG